MNEKEVGKIIDKAIDKTLEEVEDVLQDTMLLGVALATLNNFKKNLTEELKNERSKKFSK